MNKQKQDWESRFDDKFQRFYEGVFGGIVNDDTNTWYGLEDVKDFISSERQRLLEEVIEMVENIDCDFCDKENKLWNNKTETFEECSGTKHKILEALNKLKGINE